METGIRGAGVFALLVCVAALLASGCKKDSAPADSTSAANSNATQSVLTGSGSGGGALISGRVLFQGTPPEPRKLSLDALCGKLHTGDVTEADYLVGESNGLADVFVYLKDVPPGIGLAPINDKPVLDQKGCLYTPKVLGIVAHQKFRVRNSDPLLHNVHALPKKNKEFNFAQPIQGQVNEKSFNEPEVLIKIKCDVHPWMDAYVGVVPHHFFAVTDEAGRFRLPTDLPAGKYTVEAVHHKGRTTSQEITLGSGEHKQVELTISVK